MRHAPWLRRTRWSHYLCGQPPETLFALIEALISDPSDPISVT